MNAFTKQPLLGKAKYRYLLRKAFKVDARVDCATACFDRKDCHAYAYWFESQKCQLSRKNSLQGFTNSSEYWRSRYRFYNKDESVCATTTTTPAVAGTCNSKEDPAMCTGLGEYCHPEDQGAYTKKHQLLAQLAVKCPVLCNTCVVKGKDKWQLHFTKRSSYDTCTTIDSFGPTTATNYTVL